MNRTRFTRVVLILTAAGCLLALALSIHPGALEDVSLVGVCLMILLVPVVLVAGLVALFVLHRKRKLHLIRPTWAESMIFVALLLGSFVLLKLDVPRRLAFGASRTAFAPLLARATVTDYQGTPLDRKLGIYFVDRYAADPRGGVYFRVRTGPDGLGPDVMSWGFAYRPNPHGSPFAAAHYTTGPLGGDWYWFGASDDWY